MHVKSVLLLVMLKARSSKKEGGGEVHGMIVVVGSRNAEVAFRYTLLINGLGHRSLAVRETAPLLSCILDPRSGLLILEDGFVPNTSAHTLINRIRSMPGPKSSIPIIRVWKGPVLASGHDSHSVVTINAPVTARALDHAMQSLGLSRGG